MSDYWRGYRKGWYKGFVYGVLTTLVLYSLLIIFWTGTQNIFK